MNDSATLSAAPLEATTPGESTTAGSITAMREAILAKLKYHLGRFPADASTRDWYFATALAVRDRAVDHWVASARTNHAAGTRRVYYLSLEFLIGRLLFDNLTNLGLVDDTRAALSELGVDLDTVREAEPDAALGNGGLGRLAACFMESMASLAVPAFGYGIRYENGLFQQRIVNGWQTEWPEDWLSFGTPWEFGHPEIAFPVGFGGSIQAARGPDGTVRYTWKPAETINAVAYDTPIVGWRGKHVNTLRLWSARIKEGLQLDAFNRGDLVGAAARRVQAESISKVLYPSDTTPTGEELRLRQEYFFSCASLQDLIHRHLIENGDIRTLPDKVAIQLNDTHPAIAVPEMMRVLIDQHDVGFDDAWSITQRCFSYTNHTLMPEALESWPVPLMERLLPRHMQIIYLINARHLLAAEATHPDLLPAISLIDEQNGRRVRMGHTAFVGSHHINGVSALHTDLMKKTVFADLNAVLPGRIVNKTNGITFRRWLQQANPGLRQLLVETLGESVLDDPTLLKGLAAHADDPSFQDKFRAQRRANKEMLAKIVDQRLDITINPDAIFDIQIKRIHEYKRQLLNIFETIAVYNAIRANPMRDWQPRVKVFAGKAAATYERAKLIIKLANDVAEIVNSDPTVGDLLKVVFLPNYNVSLAERIIPAADVSEQISTAGLEASGTGNMKFALNGAITIGTLDGANVEIRDNVGPENIFIFGMTADEVEARKRTKGFNAQELVDNSARLAQVVQSVRGGSFSPDDPNRYRDFIDSLIAHDTFFVCADFDSYYQRQRDLISQWRNSAAWWRMSILNTANVAWFSSDRTIREYAGEIWKIDPGPDVFDGGL